MSDNQEEKFGERMYDFPIPAFHFQVSFDNGSGVYDTGFQEVSGLSSEIELETVKEGGENNFVYRLPTQVKHPNLVLKRALEATSSPLVEWCKNTLEGNLINKITPYLINIILFDKEQNPLKTWTVTNAYPVKWEAGSLGAQKNEILIETIELAYNELIIDND